MCGQEWGYWIWTKGEHWIGVPGYITARNFYDQSIRLSYVACGAQKYVPFIYDTSQAHATFSDGNARNGWQHISYTLLTVACTGNGHNQSAEEEDTSSTYRRSENLEKVSSILALRLMHICTEAAKARQTFRLQHFVSSVAINTCSSSRVPVLKNRAIKACNVRGYIP